MSHTKTAWRWVCLLAGAVIFALVLLIGTTSVFFHPVRATATPPTIMTPLGRFQGALRTVSDGSVITRYAGIPFAKPPVGDLRFRRPVPITKKMPDKVVNLGTFGKSCWSVTKKITNPYYSEDCLFLNVYVPGGSNRSNQTTCYPVMVWIHGGGFVAGSIFPEPTEFVARGQVIVVTLNYRLGVFGFLTMEDEVLPANNGLWDQILAMKWVKENIKYFRGDSDAITIFGESAGAMSAALLTISPVPSKLFNRAIFQSGSATSLLRRNPKIFAEEFGRSVGCDKNSNTTKFASCLRSISVKAILENSMTMPMNMSQAQSRIDFIWMPTVDGELIPNEPEKLFKDKNYLASINAFDKDYLFGLNNNEGSLVVKTFLSKSLPLTDIQNVTYFTDLMDFLLTMKYDVPVESLQNVSQAIIPFYTGSQNPEKVRKQTVMDFGADAIFYVPGLEMANTFSYCYQDFSLIENNTLSSESWRSECENATGRTYIYSFDFCPPKKEGEIPCMVHGADVNYMFPKKNFDDKVKQKLSEKFIDIISTFGKTGKPGPALGSEWPAYEIDHQSYLSFSPYPSVRRYPYPYRAVLWLETIRQIMEDQTE